MEGKLNNLLSFEDFEKNWKPEEQKKTKRTEVGLDIIKEASENLPTVVSRKKEESENEFGDLPDGPRYISRFIIKSETPRFNEKTGKWEYNKYTVSYDTETHQWCCSCRGWVGYRHCKHLDAMGLLGPHAPVPDRKQLK